MSALAISDNLRDVLEDIVADPKQRLFAGTCLPRVVDSFHAQPEIVRPSCTGLSAAEQHLLRVHREELSRALLHGFYNHFFAEGGPAARQNLHGVVDPDQTWKRNAHFARDNAMPAAFTEGTASWLHRLLQDRGPKSFEDYHWLTVTAETLTGSSTAQLYRGLNYDVAGKCGSAASLYELVTRTGSLKDKHASLERLGILLANQGRLDQSVIIEIEALEVALQVLDANAVGMNLARIQVLSIASGTAPRLQPKLDSLLGEFSTTVQSSLIEIAETQPSSPYWQGITCGVLDRLGGES